MATMKISEQGIALIKSFESCKLTAYKAVSTEKYWTIGWGHYGADVKAGQTISQNEADALFLSDLKQFVKYTNTYTKTLNLNQNQFDALVSFCYNCGPKKLKKLVNGRTPEEIAEHITDSEHTKSKGKVLNGLVRRRQEEKELYCKGSEVKSMDIKVGSARIDENGNISGGTAGDQTGKEVCTQDYYLHSKGWYLIRPKNVEDANKLASAMLAACKNDNIGYDQGNRLDVITQIKKYGSMAKIPIKTEADCGTLVRGCCIEAGFDPGNFNTANEAACLEKTGKFEKKVAVTSSTVLYDGDVLVTKTKGHTVIVTEGNPRGETSAGSVNGASGNKGNTLIRSLQPAQSKDSSLAGTYKTTSNLNLRYGPGKDKYDSIIILPAGTKCKCYGYYTKEAGTKWLYVVATVKGKQYTGYASCKYLIQ